MMSDVHCGVCGATFPVEKGVIDLVPVSQYEKSPAQSSMEWEPLIRVYESRLWRRNPVFSLLLGISFDKECALILDTAGFKGDEILLDLACGPGIYSRPFARTLEQGTVVGLDLSMPVLHYAVKRAHTEGINNLIFIHGDALDLPFPDNQFDAVNCCGAFHLFPYLEVLQGIKRVLNPGGRFTVAVGWERIPGKLGRKHRDFYFRRAGVHLFYKDELESLIREAGFADVTCLHAKGSWLIVSGVKPQ
jgi:ubiquinone/menaquinone biosynthesis C-methylase UbiE